MSYAEDYIDPFNETCDHGLIDCNDCMVDADEPDDELWGCAYPEGCLMPSPMHSRDECHTVEDMEAYYAEELAVVGKE